MEGPIAGTEGRRLEGAAPPAPRPAASTPPPGRQPASPEVGCPPWAPPPAPAAPSQSLAARAPGPPASEGPPGPPAILEGPPTGTFSETVISGCAGLAPSREVDACASTAFRGTMGHTNAISDECSSKSGAGGERPGPATGAGPPGPPGHPAPGPPTLLGQTKTVSHRPLHYDIPSAAEVAAEAPARQESPASSTLAAGRPQCRADKGQPQPTYPAAGALPPATPCLSSAPAPAAPRRGGWSAPPGGGLRGGAPLPGETSAISNGTTGWGPPPSGGNSVSSSGGGGWGTAQPTQQSAASAWGAPPDPAQGRPAPGAGGQPDAPHYNLPSFPEEGSNNSKMLNSHSQQQPSQLASSQPSAAPPAHQQQQQQAPGPGVPQSNTSWAAAAGKGLPPSEPATNATNGSTNKQLEQLNSVREALFSQDGWGGQNVKQDTSWDVGNAPSEPVPAAALPSKADSMQWQAPNPGRNDGTDLWKSTLSGVPQQVKPQVATPWGNHTPTNPADYKNWGEDESSGGGGGLNEGGDGMFRGDGFGGPGPGGPGQPWEERGMAARFDRGDQRPDWANPPKPKEDPMWGGSSGQWGGPGGDQGPRGRGGEPTNWGPPPQGRPGGAQGGNWGAGGPGMGQKAASWDDASPPVPRRAYGEDPGGDIAGTGLWGQKEPRGPAPPGGWKAMPTPGDLVGRPGPGRMPGGPMKEQLPGASPWGQPHPGSRWDQGGDMGGTWGAKEEPRWSSDEPWSGGRGPKQPGPMRSSPSWGDDPMAAGDRWGPRPGGGVSKDMIWGSKQFRILVEMGFRKEDVETALRQTNMQLEDALEMLNAVGRGGGGMPGRGLPPDNMFGPRGEDMFGGPRGFPGPGPMPPYPAGEIPPTTPSMAGPGLNNPSRNIQPGMMMNGSGPGLHNPPRPQPSGPPSTSQLRVLVQQIQMAVQAGHLNPQILNQPLAPQTLLLLNQLLQQIKQLQSYQQQHVIAQQGQRPGGPSNQALLALTVQITKHKQQIQNLQNQITAQQAQYLKNQQPQAPPAGGHGTPDDLLVGGMDNMSMGGPGQAQGAGGSKVLKIIGGDKFSEEFPKAPGAPGSGRAPNSQSSPNLLLENNGPWSNAHGGDAGWPSSGEKPANTSTEEDNFGIPEFVPGKAWKGTAMKDPSEDPTLTPGSVAPPSTTVTTAENSLGLTSSTWSFNSTNSKEGGANPAPKEPWGNSALPTSSSATNLTAMGQDLWGQGRTAAAGKQQTPGSSSGWPSTNGLASSGGWSNGTNGGNSTTTTTAPQGAPGQASAWLLLKNLTTQIDGSTLNTLCKQHGPLINFHLYLPHGIALVKYSNGQEAKKAQNALNNCVLGNTTILAETTGEHEVELILRTISSGGQGGGQPSVSHRGSTPAAPFGGAYTSLAKSTSGDTWSALGSGVSLGWPSTSSSTSSSGLGGSVWGAPDSDQHNRNTPLNSFLPNDLLAEGM